MYVRVRALTLNLRGRVNPRGLALTLNLRVDPRCIFAVHNVTHPIAALCRACWVFFCARSCVFGLRSEEGCAWFPIKQITDLIP